MIWPIISSGTKLLKSIYGIVIHLQTTPKVSASITSKVETPKYVTRQSESGESKSTTKKSVESEESKSTTKKPVESEESITCIQCGRERTLSKARSSRFCTQRCIINWMEANPGKMPKEAVGDKALEGLMVNDAASPAPPCSNSPLSSTSKGISRALKNLEIDMAGPGAKLTNLSDASDSSSDSSSPVQDSADAATTTAATSKIDSLATMITQTQKQMLTSKGVEVLPAAAATTNSATKTPTEPAKTSTPTAKGAKRSATSQLTLSSTKKAKIATKTLAQASSKSVSFNLNPEENATSGASTATMLPLIASFLQQPKKSHDGTKVKIPPGNKINQVGTWDNWVYFSSVNNIYTKYIIKL